MCFQKLIMENRKDYLAEFFGTFLLVFFGTGSIVVSDEFGIIHGFGISVVFGLTVWLLVQFFGLFSDCHINPAVSITMFIDKKLSLKKMLFYVFFQLIGALLASFVLSNLFTENLNLGNTLPRNLWQEAFVYEFFLSFILMLVILITSSVSVLKRFAPFLIGFTVFLEAWLAGPVCGASMNPARTFGPAIVSGNTTYLALYILAPVLGMITVLFIFNKTKNALK
jgi:aquaporin NIP